MELWKELEGKLAVAEQNKKDAEDTLKEILGSLDEAGGELDKVIERLTPAPTPGTPAGGEGETGGAGDTEEGGAGEAATVVTPVALAAAPAAQATVVAQNQAAAPLYRSLTKQHLLQKQLLQIHRKPFRLVPIRKRPRKP